MVSSGLIIGIVIGGIVLAVVLFCFNNATRQVSIDSEVEKIVRVVGVDEKTSKVANDVAKLATGSLYLNRDIRVRMVNFSRKYGTAGAAQILFLFAFKQILLDSQGLMRLSMAETLNFKAFLGIVYMYVSKERNIPTDMINSIIGELVCLIPDTHDNKINEMTDFI
jgi:hypothetical protein